jgi:putative ABC transport system permease protein
VLRRLRIALLPVPGQALGLAVLVAVLAAAVVSAPLMAASAEQAAWEQQEDRLPSWALGTTVLSSTFTGDGRSPVDRIERMDELDAAVTAAAEQSGLASPTLLTRLRFPALTRVPGGVAETAVVHATGAADHLEIVAGAASDDGVLIPEQLAADANVVPGSALLMTGQDGGAPVRVPVSGIYVTPQDPVPAFWTPREYLFLPRFEPGGLDPVPPPPVVFLPRGLVSATYEGLREDVLLEWFSPLAPSIGVAEARRAADSVAELQLRLTDPGAPAAQLVTGENYADLLPRSALPEVLTDVDRTVELLAPPVRAVGIGGGVAALVLVGAWAGLRVRRRDDELRSLAARGLSPGRGAGHAVRESLLPVVAGLAVGGAAGWLLVRTLGPSPDLPGAVVAPAGWSLLAAAVAVAALVAVVTAVLVTRLDRVGRVHGTVLRRVPWLGLTAVAAVLTAVPLVTGSAGGEAGRIGVLPLLLPLLVTVVAAGVVTAALPAIGRALGSRLRGLPPAGYLAVRRLLAGQGTARLVVVTTALALGLVAYAGALAESTDRTIAAKASVATGSDVVVPIARTSPRGGELPGDAMLVGTDTTPVVVPGDMPADLLLVHPDDVPAVVRWDDSFADRSLAELMAALRDYRGDRVPVVLAGPLPDATLDATDGALVLDFPHYSIPVEVVGRAAAFPGQDSREPLLVGDWDRYVQALDAVSRVPELVVGREVWARGEAADVVASVAAAGLEPTEGGEIASADDFSARPELDAQTWTLGYLRAVALAAGVLGLVGVALHALSQQRRRSAAALLLTRMGMSRRSADVTTALEIGLLTGLAAVVAVAVALPSSALVLGALDPVPGLRPDPLFAVPWGDLGELVAGVALATVGAAALVGRTARRDSGGQVLRDAA